MIDFSALDPLLERVQPTFWWRDDDATRPGPALDRLIGLTEDVGAPLMLASIPASTTEALAKRIETHAQICVAVHGWAHENHAPPNEKKAEFGAHRPLSALSRDASLGKERIDQMFGKQAVPVFVPPWNRFSDALPETLKQLEYKGISGFKLREIERGPIRRFDAHLDPVDWRASRSAVNPQALIANLSELLKNPALIGLMTHHAMHDEAIWELTAALARYLTARGASWISAAQLLDSPC